MAYLPDWLSEVCREHDEIMATRDAGPAAEAHRHRLQTRAAVEQLKQERAAEPAAPPPAPTDRDAQLATWGELHDVMGLVIADERARERAEVQQALEPLQRELTKLQGQVELLAGLLRSDPIKSDKVIDLPAWRRGAA